MLQENNPEDVPAAMQNSLPTGSLFVVPINAMQ